MSGFLHLVFVIFIATHVRLVLENIAKYGLLVQPPSAAAVTTPAAAPLIGLASLAVPILLALAIEQAAISIRPSHLFMIDVLHTLNAFSALAVPCVLVGVDAGGGGTVGGMFLLGCAITLFLKLCSWAHVHHDLRLADRESSQSADLDMRLAKFSSGVADTDGRRNIHYPGNVVRRPRSAEHRNTLNLSQDPPLPPLPPPPRRRRCRRRRSGRDSLQAALFTWTGRRRPAHRRLVHPIPSRVGSH